MERAEGGRGGEGGAGGREEERFRVGCRGDELAAGQRGALAAAAPPEHLGLQQPAARRQQPPQGRAARGDGRATGPGRAAQRHEEAPREAPGREQAPGSPAASLS